MLKTHLGDIAADPQASKDLLRFAYRVASQDRNDVALAALATNPALPDDLASLLDSSSSARVLSARLGLPTADPQRIMVAASDKRATVAGAVAQTVGLDQEVYGVVLTRHGKSPSVLFTLLANPSVSPEHRQQAVLKLAFSKVNWCHSQSSTRYGRQFVAAVDEFPHLAPQIARATSFDVLALLLTSRAVDPGMVRQIVERALDATETMEQVPATAGPRDRTVYRGLRYPGAEGDVASVFLAASQYSDRPADLIREYCKKLDSMPDPVRLWFRTSLRAVMGGTGSVRGRLLHGAPDEPAGLATSMASLQILISQSRTFADRVKAATAYEVTDDQFATLMLVKAHNWPMYPDRCDTPAFTAACAQLAHASATSPARLGLMLGSLGSQRIPDGLLTAQNMHEVITAMMGVDVGAEDDRWHFKSHEWLLPLLDLGVLDDHIASAVPGTLATDPVAHSLKHSGEAEVVLARWRTLLGRYLFARLGDNEQAWMVLASLASTWPGSLLELVRSAREACDLPAHDPAPATSS